MVDGVLVEEVGGDDLLDDLLEKLGPEVLGGDLLSVLGGDDDGVDSDGDGGSSILLVLDGDLGLRVRSEPSEGSISSSGGHGSVELVSEHDRKGHELLSLVGSVSEPEESRKDGGSEVSEGKEMRWPREESRTNMIPWSLKEGKQQFKGQLELETMIDRIKKRTNPAPWFSRSPWSSP